MIKKILQICSILLLLGWSQNGFSQSPLDSNLQQILVTRINKLAVRQKSTKLIDSLIATKTIVRHDLNCQLNTTATYIKGKNLSQNLDKYSNVEKELHIQSLIAEFDESIKEYKKCKGKILDIKARFLQDVNFKGPEYYETMKSLDSLKFKKKYKRPITLGANFMTSVNTQWLGLRLGLASIKYVKVKQAKYVTTTIHAITAQYSKNLNRAGYEWLFGIAERDATFAINPIKFGFNHYVADTETNTKNRWFYRPEIGLNIRNFQVAFGYSIYFKEDVKNVDKAHLMVRSWF